LLNHCSSPLGKQKLQTALQRPLNDVQRITERLNTLEALLDPSAVDWVDAATETIKMVSVESHKLLRKMASLNASARDWNQLLMMCIASSKLSELGNACPHQNLEIFRRMRSLRNSSNLARDIIATIDFDESARQDRVVVRGEVDHTLDHLRSQYQNLPSLLNDIAKDLSAMYPYPALRCVFFPQSGFHIALRFQDGVPLDAQYSNIGLDYRFHSSSYIYFKSEHMIQLDTELRTIFFVVAPNFCDLQLIVFLY
jgi:hypothetical protein